MSDHTQRNPVGVRLSYEKLEAMYIEFKGIEEDFDYVTDHDKLLLVMMQLIKARIKGMVDRNQAVYTLHLNAAESLAFKQCWDRVARYQDRYTQTVVGGLVKKVNETAIAPKA